MTDGMSKTQIVHYLMALNEELQSQGVIGEVCLYGGAVMCLVFNARPSTIDIDATFKPAREMIHGIFKVAEKYHLPHSWLNDEIKNYLQSEHKRKKLFEFSNLRVYYADPRYILSMKVLSLRPDTQDVADIKFLIKELGISSKEELLALVKKYYPHRDLYYDHHLLDEFFD